MPAERGKVDFSPIAGEDVTFVVDLLVIGAGALERYLLFKILGLGFFFISPPEERFKGVAKREECGGRWVFRASTWRLDGVNSAVVSKFAPPVSKKNSVVRPLLAAAALLPLPLSRGKDILDALHSC